MVDKVEPMKVSEYLKNVDYKTMNYGEYVPSDFALKFINFIKLVNGDEGEDNISPNMHYKMLDQLITKNFKTINLCFRGSGKTSVFGEYLVLYLAVFEKLPNFGKVYAMLYVADTMENGAKSLRNNIESRYDNSKFLQQYLTKAVFTDKKLSFRNLNGHKLECRLFGAETGVRGTKMQAKRPTLAILDDLIGDKQGRSATSLKNIDDTINETLIPALDPNKQKIIFNGTPFDSSDPIYRRVESGVWNVNAFPICEKFPCSKEEFVGAWEDRFGYDFVKRSYDDAVAEGKVAAFNQEFMLNITSVEDRLIQDEDIIWFNLKTVTPNLHYYNVYITTDFATSDKQSADYSVISVWAVNHNQQYYLIDGMCARQGMSENVDALFRFATKYSSNLQTVGIEISGQQGGFIDWILNEQINRNVFFTLAKERGKKTRGIKPTVNKLSRLNLVVPEFSKNNVFFPNELKHTSFLREFIDEIEKATGEGLKGKDDCLDTLSMLMFMNIVPPVKVENMSSNSGQFNVYNETKEIIINSKYSSYIVN